MLLASLLLIAGFSTVTDFPTDSDGLAAVNVTYGKFPFEILKRHHHESNIKLFSVS
jgi:hypothetical protein